MPEKRLFDNFPYYVKIADGQSGGVISHICDQGIQPQYDDMYRILRLLDSAFDPRYPSADKFIDDIAQMLGLIEHKDHWLGVGLNPTWSSEKKRAVVTNIYQYWMQKGTEGCLQKALNIWGTDKTVPSFPFKLSEEIVLHNTELHKTDRIGLWTYYTPFNYNDFKPLPIQRRLGVGDHWEKKKDYVDDTDIKKNEIAYTWDGVTEILTADLAIADNLSVNNQQTVNIGFNLKKMEVSLEFAERSRKLTKETTLVEINIPPLSALQRTGYWDKNILVNVQFSRNQGQDISLYWQNINGQLPSLLIETIDVNQTPHIIYHCNSSIGFTIHKPSPDFMLTGDISTDYPFLLDLYNANLFRLSIMTSYGERNLTPKNVYWQNGSKTKNYYYGDHVLEPPIYPPPPIDPNDPILHPDHPYGRYLFPNGKYNYLVLEFNLVSTIEETEMISSWTLKNGNIVMESMTFSQPLLFKPSETIFLAFNINIQLATLS